MLLAEMQQQQHTSRLFSQLLGLFCAARKAARPRASIPTQATAMVSLDGGCLVPPLEQVFRPMTCKPLERCHRLGSNPLVTRGSWLATLEAKANLIAERRREGWEARARTPRIELTAHQMRLLPYLRRAELSQKSLLLFHVALASRRLPLVSFCLRKVRRDGKQASDREGRAGFPGWS